MKKKDLWIISMALVSSNFAHAASKDLCCGVKFNGYIDASFNHLAADNQFISDVFDRAFDIKEDGFTLQQLAATFAYQPENGFGVLINPLYGRDAILTGPYGWDTQTGDGPIGFDVLQAYAQYAAPPTTLIAGRFVTLAGYEVVEATANHHYSRGLLFTFAIPISHLGVRTNFKLRNQLQFIIGVNNGWDNIRDTSRDKTIEFGMQYNPCERLSLAATIYSGEERIIPRTATGPEGRRNLLDLVASYQLTDDMRIGANYDYGVQRNVLVDTSVPTINAVWQGLALYYTYEFSPIWRASLRGEHFSDRDGYRTGIQQDVKEVTVTLAYSPIQNLKIRGEARRDFSNEYAYVDRDSDNLRKTQQSYAIEAIYKFSNQQKRHLPPVYESNIVKSDLPVVQQHPVSIREVHPLMKMDPDHYIVQLLGVQIDVNAEQFILNHGLQGQAFYFPSTRKGKDWYVVVYGDYASKAAADEAKSNLARTLNVKPWVRRVRDVQKEMMQ